jgi:hypothetical protein
MTAPEILPDPLTQSASLATPQPSGEGGSSGPVPSQSNDETKKYRGKIPKLSKAQRDQINKLLDEGASYDHVAEVMNAEHGAGLNKVNVYNWYHSGFQEYITRQDWLTEMRNVREGASDLIEPTDTLKLHQSANQLAVLQIFKTLMNDTLKDDHINRIRAMNALSRLSREALIFKKYEDSLAKDQPAVTELKQLDKTRELSETEQNLIQDRWDQAFKIHPNHLRSKTPITPIESSSTPAPAEVGLALRSEPSRKGKDDFHIVPDQNPPAPEPSAFNLDPATKPQPPVAVEVTRLQSINPEAVKTPEAQTSTKATTPEPATFNQQPATNPAPSIANSEPGLAAICVNPCPSVVRNSSERCHSCKTLLPPLLENGERPNPTCDKCKTSLRHPKLLHLYCPHCSQRMDTIFDDNGKRTSDYCPKCLQSLLPDPEPNELSHAE